MLCGMGPIQYHNRLIISPAKKIIKMFNANYLSHTTALFFQSKILKVADIHEYLLAQYMYKQQM